MERLIQRLPLGVVVISIIERVLARLNLLHRKTFTVKLKAALLSQEHAQLIRCGKNELRHGKS